MKKALPYIIIAIVLVVVAAQCMRGKVAEELKTLITLNKRDKNPYGAYVFHESLRSFFPKATFVNNLSRPGNSKALNGYEEQQLYVIMVPEFEPDEYEFEELISFIDRGNTVFISTFDINYIVDKFLKTRGELNNFFTVYPFGNNGVDTMQATLTAPVFENNYTYTYPGKIAEGFFTKTDSTIARVIGRGDNGKPNFIHLKKGSGDLYLQLSPLALSNYFLLYDNNMQYFEKIFSQLPATTSTVIWDEYFINGKHSENKNRGWFSAIMKNPYFRAGILTALVLLLIYTLSEMRRRQRAIPVMVKPVNDSLQFVKTMGLLYYEKGDHTNLAQKMAAYFLEHVRSNYKIFSRDMDQTFVKELSDKSGVRENLVDAIVGKIRRINNNETFDQLLVIELQQNIEDFYNNK